MDIDLATHCITGSATIIIIPLIQNLEYVTFDCKEMTIKDVLVENRRCDQFIHDDPLQTNLNGLTSQNVLYSDNSIEQSHFLRSKFASLNEYPETDSKSQLTIKIPSSIKISLEDANALSNYTPITPSIKTTLGFKNLFSLQLHYKLNMKSETQSRVLNSILCMLTSPGYGTFTLQMVRFVVLHHIGSHVSICLMKNLHGS